jgi:hypothetical protein
MSRLLRTLVPSLLLGFWGCGGGSRVAIDSGPCVVSVGPDSATITWTTSEPADSVIEWFTDEPLGAIRVETKETSHTVRLTGLQPDTRYRYRACSGGAASAVQTFRTAPAELRPFTFAACAGSDDANALARLADALLEGDPAFVCRVGDWPTANTLTASLPVLAPAEQCWRSFVYLNTETFVVDAAGLRAGDTQCRWLETQLGHSEAEWKIVVCRPSPLDERVLHTLLPLLLDGDVDLVVAGAEEAAPVRAVGSGEEPGKNAVTIATLGAAAGHALLATVDRETLVLRSIAPDGTEGDERTLRKERGKRDISDARSIEMLLIPPLFQPADGFDMGTVGEGPVTRRFEVAIANPCSAPMRGELRWIVHPNTTWNLDPPLVQIAVPPRSRSAVSFTAGIAGRDVDPAPTATFMCGEQNVPIETSPFRFTLSP